jgi:hypothetical protein
MKGLQYLIGGALVLAFAVLAVMGTGGVAMLVILPAVRIAAVIVGCIAIWLIVLRLRANISVAIVCSIPPAVNTYIYAAPYFGLPYRDLRSGSWMIEPVLWLFAALSLLYLSGHVKRLVASSALGAERQ